MSVLKILVVTFVVFIDAAFGGDALSSDNSIEDLQQSLTAEQLRTLLSANLSSDQAKLFNVEQIRSMTPEQIQALTPSQLVRLAASVPAELSAEQLSGLTPSQLRAFSPAQLEELTLEQWKAFTPAQWKEFTPAQLRQFNIDAAEGIPPDEMKSLLMKIIHGASNLTDSQTILSGLPTFFESQPNITMPIGISNSPALSDGFRGAGIPPNLSSIIGSISVGRPSVPGVPSIPSIAPGFPTGGLPSTPGLPSGFLPNMPELPPPILGLPSELPANLSNVQLGHPPNVPGFPPLTLPIASEITRMPSIAGIGSLPIGLSGLPSIPVQPSGKPPTPVEFPNIPGLPTGLPPGMQPPTLPAIAGEVLPTGIFNTGVPHLSQIVGMPPFPTGVPLAGFQQSGIPSIANISTGLAQLSTGGSPGLPHVSDIAGGLRLPNGVPKIPSLPFTPTTADVAGDSIHIPGKPSNFSRLAGELPRIPNLLPNITTLSATSPTVPETAEGLPHLPIGPSYPGISARFPSVLNASSSIISALPTAVPSIPPNRAGVIGGLPTAVKAGFPDNLSSVPAIPQDLGAIIAGLPQGTTVQHPTIPQLAANRGGAATPFNGKLPATVSKGHGYSGMVTQVVEKLSSTDVGDVQSISMQQLPIKLPESSLNLPTKNVNEAVQQFKENLVPQATSDNIREVITGGFAKVFDSAAAQRVLEEAQKGGKLGRKNNNDKGRDDKGRDDKGRDDKGRDDKGKQDKDTKGIGKGARNDDRMLAECKLGIGAGCEHTMSLPKEQSTKWDLAPAAVGNLKSSAKEPVASATPSFHTFSEPPKVLATQKRSLDTAAGSKLTQNERLTLQNLEELVGKFPHTGLPNINAFNLSSLTAEQGLPKVDTKASKSTFLKGADSIMLNDEITKDGDTTAPSTEKFNILSNLEKGGQTFTTNEKVHPLFKGETITHPNRSKLTKPTDVLTGGETPEIDSTSLDANLANIGEKLPHVGSGLNLKGKFAPFAEKIDVSEETAADNNALNKNIRRT